jgi:signal transduction histidine kinase
MRSRNATVTELRRQEDELASALRRLEEVAADLQRKNQMLEQQDRLASLGLLSASVAHELNTPLSVLHGSIEKLIETVRDQAAQERLARMLRVTQRLRKISEGLVDFARVRKQELEAVELHSLIDEAWALVAIDEKAAEVSFSNQVRPQDAVIGNPDRLVQVFVNLLRNSLGALQSGGTVVVHSRASEQIGRSSLFITVEDDGPGIPEEVLPDIFDAFVSTRLDSRGTGLGLTVAEGIVQQHGGAIRAFNRSEGGASIEVRLPAAVNSSKNVPSMP